MIYQTLSVLRAPLAHTHGIYILARKQRKRSSLRTRDGGMLGEHFRDLIKLQRAKHFGGKRHSSFLSFGHSDRSVLYFGSTSL